MANKIKIMHSHSQKTSKKNKTKRSSALEYALSETKDVSSLGFKSLIVVITAWKEPKTVADLVKQVEKDFQTLKRKNIFQEFKIILAAPDKATLQAGYDADKLGVLHLIKDKGDGKPAALNLILPKLKEADIVVFTDGDLRWGSDTIEKLLKPFTSSSKIVASSGRPMPINSRKTILGYWAWLTTQAGAHNVRLQNYKERKFINLSGYIFAIKPEFLPQKINKDLLTEDVYFSHYVYKKGGVIGYAPDAIVYVKFPTTFKDWINQKKRASGGDYQIHRMFPNVETMRSFTKEIRHIGEIISYASKPIELLYGVLLAFARLYMWFLIFIDQKILKKNSRDIWVRIESTKDL